MKDTKTVLLIDDEAHILELGQQFLHRSGYSVITAGNCEEGMTRFLIYDVDLIILDLGLPKTDGMQCLEQLLTADRNANIIIVSGNPSDGRIQEAIKIGAKAFLAKPFGLAELQAAVSKLLDQC
ncbi:MAG: response regulator [Desulfobacterales bacterium]